MLYALIQNGEIENIVIGDPDCVPSLQQFCDSVVDITNLIVQPAIGWLYDGTNFSPGD